MDGAADQEPFMLRQSKPGSVRGADSGRLFTCKGQIKLDIACHLHALRGNPEFGKTGLILRGDKR